MFRWMRLPKALILFVGLVFVLFLMAACGDGDDDSPPVDVGPIERGADVSIVIPAGEPIIIGISTALTGGPTGVRGAEYRDAAITAIERWKGANSELIGGHEIQVHAEDDGCSNAEITRRAAGHRLRGEDGHRQLPGLVGVIGPQCPAGVAAVIDDYAEAGIVMISGSATATTLTDDQGENGFFFRTAYRNDLEGTLIGLFVSGNEELGIESAVIEVPFEQAGQISHHQVYAHTKRAVLRHPECDGILLFGSGWRSLDAIELLEQDLGLPVAHPVPARVWSVQKRLRVNEPVAGYGRLLEEML